MHQRGETYGPARERSAAPLALDVDARDVAVVAEVHELLEVVLESRRAARVDRRRERVVVARLAVDAHRVELLAHLEVAEDRVQAQGAGPAERRGPERVLVVDVLLAHVVLGPV